MLVRALFRALRLRCAACGSRGVVQRWFAMADRCPGCGREMEREEGYFLGALTVNLAVTELAFLAVFVGGMVVTWPQVPWTGLLVASVATNAIVPVVFYPFSKTVWVALDVGFLQRLQPASSEEEAARRNAV